MSLRRRRAGLPVASLMLLLAVGAAMPAGAAARPPDVDGLTVGFQGRLPARVSNRLELMAERIAEHTAKRDAQAAASGFDGGIVVTTLEDTVAADGACSLREAILASRYTDDWEPPETEGDCGPVEPWGFAVITFAIGGTIELTDDLPVILDWLTIDGSSAPEPVVIDGGGLHRPLRVDSQASLDIYGLTLTNGWSATTGGAILNHGFLFAIDVVVAGNRAELAGGGINATAGSATWMGSARVTGNSTGGAGGGIRSAGTLIVLDGVIADNVAATGGGVEGLAIGRSDATILELVTLSGNTATDPATGGGAIDSRGFLGLADVTIAGNTAASGGGIRERGEALLYFTTITGNAAATGSGLVSTGAPYLNSTLVLGNTGAASELDGTVDPTSVANLTELPAGLAVDDVLDPAGLADNGGTTPTVALVRSDENPARGAADPELCADLPIDQRGFARSAACDIGAYEIDDVAPEVAAPVPGLVARGRLDGSALDGNVRWSAVDAGSGTVAQELEASVDGGAWTPVAVVPEDDTLRVAYLPGSSYRFRARATDADGNVSEWVTGPQVTATLVQQGDASVDRSRGWVTATGPGFSGGTARYAREPLAWIKVRATGRTFSFISTTGPSRGKAKVYVNGVYVTTIDLRSPSTRYRVQAWTKTFATAKERTIKIVLLGTSGRPRVDADAFAILQ